MKTATNSAFVSRDADKRPVSVATKQPQYFNFQSEDGVLVEKKELLDSAGPTGTAGLSLLSGSRSKYGGGTARRSRRARVKGGRRNPGRNNPGQLSRVPPSLDSVTTGSTILRFQASQDVSNLAITYANIAGALGGVCTVVNSTVTAWSSSFRIKCIDAWTVNPLGDSTRFEIVETSSQYMPQKDVSWVQMGPLGGSAPVPIRWKPSPNSFLGEWVTANTFQGGVAAQLLTITAPSGCVLDLHIAYTLSNNIGGVSISGFAAAVLGTVYYLALDGRASNKLSPMGRPSTA